jgi:hypothetical protein
LTLECRRNQEDPELTGGREDGRGDDEKKRCGIAKMKKYR